MQVAASGGGSPTVLASGEGTLSLIAVDGGRVYWISGDASAVRACAIGGCGGQAESIATGQNNAYAVAADGTGVVYWTNRGTSRGYDGAVMRLRPGEGAPTQVASNIWGPGPLVVAGPSVFWANGDQSAMMAPR
jgi:hypothetical protein